MGHILDLGSKTNIKNNIRDFLDLHNLTLEDFAEEVGTTKQNISNILKDRSSPSIDLIDSMAVFMLCSPGDILKENYFKQFKVKIVRSKK